MVPTQTLSAAHAFSLPQPRPAPQPARLTLVSEGVRHVPADLAAFARIKAALNVPPRRRGLIALAVLSVAVHGLVVSSWQDGAAVPEAEQPVQIPPMTVELYRAEPQPPAVQPPPPQPAPARALVPPRENVVALKPQPVAAAPAEPAPPAPVAAPPAPPAAPVAAAEAPVTPPLGRAGYLSNPSPHYPDVAIRRKWEGEVRLKVHVLASGRADSVAVQQSSGHDALDDVAVETVRTWIFVPAKRGDVAIDSWGEVPIEFKLPKG